MNKSKYSTYSTSAWPLLLSGCVTQIGISCSNQIHVADVWFTLGVRHRNYYQHSQLCSAISPYNGYWGSQNWHGGSSEAQAPHLSDSSSPKITAYICAWWCSTIGNIKILPSREGLRPREDSLKYTPRNAPRVQDFLHLWQFKENILIEGNIWASYYKLYMCIFCGQMGMEYELMMRLLQQRDHYERWKVLT
jgi:hypothetical protein